jgi:hypothetical protein
VSKRCLRGGGIIEDIFGVGVAEDGLQESGLAVVVLADEHELGRVEAGVQPTGPQQESFVKDWGDQVRVGMAHSLARPMILLKVS